jgi:isochorismate pyruvate lyase
VDQKFKNSAPFTAVEPERCQSIQEIRAGVDEIDLALLKLLARRQAYAVRSVKIKIDAGMPRAPDEKRIMQQIERAKALGLEMGVSPIIVEPLFRTMIAQHVEFEFNEYTRLGEMTVELAVGTFQLSTKLVRR